MPTGNSNNGRVVVVTGGSAGVGRAVVRGFAKEGARIAVLARGEEGVGAAVADATAMGASAIGVPTDVSDIGAVDAAADRVERELGPIDVWVNDAMASVFALFWDVDPEEFRRATEVTYLGVVWGSRAALTRMRPRDSRGAGPGWIRARLPGYPVAVRILRGQSTVLSGSQSRCAPSCYMRRAR